MRYASLMLLLLLVSCKKETPVDTNDHFTLDNGMLVLCEGLFQQNNSSISWVRDDNSLIDNQFFLNNTGRSLGDTGNDMIRYGNKIYIVVNVSSTIEVLSAIDFSPIKQISMLAGSVAKQPRVACSHNGKIYISCFDGFVDVMDTSSLTITQRIAVGPNPEGVAVANNKLYVANSGGLNSQNMDSTVSVIDLSSNTEIDRIVVGLNPGTVLADNDGDIYVISRGDYSAIPSRLHRINSVSDQLVQSFPFDASGLTIGPEGLIVTNYNYTSQSMSVRSFNTSTETIAGSELLNLTGVSTLYGVHYRSSTGEFYVTDAMGFTNSGYVRKFDASGQLLESFHVGLNPSKIIFYD